MKLLSLVTNYSSDGNKEHAVLEAPMQTAMQRTAGNKSAVEGGPLSANSFLIAELEQLHFNVQYLNANRYFSLMLTTIHLYFILLLMVSKLRLSCGAFPYNISLKFHSSGVEGRDKYVFGDISWILHGNVFRKQNIQLTILSFFSFDWKCQTGAESSVE